MLTPKQVTGVKVVPAASPSDLLASRRNGLPLRVFGGMPLMAGGSGPITLVSCGAHQVPTQYWEAGKTPEPPIAPNTGTGDPSNTLDDQGEYWYDESTWISNHGAEQGHAWPYMSPGPLLERQDIGTPGTGTSQFWPANIINQGINHYQRGFPYRRWMFGRRAGRFHILTGGNVVVNDGSDPTRPYAIEFALAPGLSLRWNSGDGGGSGASSGLLPTNRTTGFRTPDFTFNDLTPGFGDPGSALFFCEIWGMAVYRGISFWTADVTLAKAPYEGLTATGLYAPIWHERRSFFLSTTQVNFDLHDGNMAFLFKIDSKSPTTQLITYSGTLSGTISAGDAVSKGGVSGTVISHDEDLEQILVGRINNTSFGSSGTLTGSSGSVTITGSSNQYQQFGKVNNAAWSASPASGKWCPNMPQDGTAAAYQADFFHVDFYPGC